MEFPKKPKTEPIPSKYEHNVLMEFPKKPKTEETYGEFEHNVMEFPKEPKTEKTDQNVKTEFTKKPKTEYYYRTRSASSSKKPKLETPKHEHATTVPKTEEGTNSEHDHTATMAPKTEAGTVSEQEYITILETASNISEYEKQREENIRRNREIFSSLHIQQKSSDLSSVLRSQRKLSTTRPAKTAQNADITPRKSLRALGIPAPNIQLSFANVPFMAPPPVPASPFLFFDVCTRTVPYQPLIEAVQSAEEIGKRDFEVTKDLDLRFDLELKKENVRRIVEERIMVLKFLPVLDRQIILTGNKEGYLGFWDADLKRENEGLDDVFVFLPHRSPVSGISVHPSSVRKIYSSCYDGDLCLMDLEKEMFDMVHSSDCPIFTLCESPTNHNLLYLGQDGPVKSFDERAGKICDTWELHDQRINTIDFNPSNSNIFATSCTDGSVLIWDLRKINKNHYESIKEIHHNRLVRSAYFSPNGTSLVTSVDDTIRLFSGSNYDKFSVIKHNNGIERRNSSLRAIWGWSEKYILIGDKEREINVISTVDKAITPIRSEYVTHSPSRFAINPYKEGHLACAGGGKLFLWTKI